MASKLNAPSDIDTYIASFPDAVQILLRKTRQAIRKAAPEAREKISYGMPTFDLHGNLVHFAAHKGHIGFYGTPSAHAEFKKDLARFEGAKGSVKFPFEMPLPLDVVARIVKFRVKENLDRQKAKSKPKTQAKARTNSEPKAKTTARKRK